LDFINEALLQGPTPIKHILLIQIRCSASESQPPSNGSHGWFFQTGAPLTTLTNVRDTAQVARNDYEIELLRDVFRRRNPPVFILPVVLESPQRDVPLSWHLTRNEKDEIRKAWDCKFTSDAGSSCQLRTVNEFLQGMGDLNPALPRNQDLPLAFLNVCGLEDTKAVDRCQGGTRPTRQP
jgi:hypothetical protein